MESTSKMQKTCLALYGSCVLLETKYLILKGGHLYTMVKEHVYTHLGIY
jgi:hypothetical protein